MYSLDKAFDYFIDWMETQDFSTSTKKEYKSIILKFKEFISQDIKYINEVTYLVLSKFIDNQRSECKSEKTIYKYYMSLKTFFNLMYSIEVIEYKPTDRIIVERPKSNEEFYYINYDEIEEIINTVKTVKNSLRRFTDIAYVRLLAETGTRRSDALRLNWNDINFKDKKINIYVQKSRKQIKVPISETLYADLISLAKYVRLNTNYNPFNPVFLSNSKKRLSTSTINTYFKEYVEQSGVIKKRIDIINNQELSVIEKQEEIKKVKITLHTLKHCFITKCFIEGKTVYDIKDLTGNLDLDCLMRYKSQIKNETAKISLLLNTYRQASM